MALCWEWCCRSGNSRAVSLLRKIRQDGVRLPTHPLTSRREQRSRRGVGSTRHPCRQASLRVSLRRGAGRPQPPAMGALSVIQWCAAPGPVACRRLGSVCQPCHAPARFAPELSQAGQDRPRPFGRSAGPRRLSGPFATCGQWRRQTRAGVCLKPRLILCLAYVERVCPCRAPNAPWPDL